MRADILVLLLILRGKYSVFIFKYDVSCGFSMMCFIRLRKLSWAPMVWKAMIRRIMA
jgi:hypothetical protein